MTALTAVLVTGIAAAGPPEGLASPRLIDSLAAAPGTQTQEIRERTCRYQWVDKATWTDREEQRTLECVVNKFGPIDGGIDKARQVGSCESGWYRLANNGGSYLGLFQHAASAWSARVAWAMPDGWRVGPWSSWRNSRAQIVVTVRMVHASGWGAWSCA
jgi:hypothetical protein